MSVARTCAVALHGVQPALIDVEADLGNGIPGFLILGLPDASLNEARERIKAAARNSGIPLANRKLTVNLSPATLPKFGSGFDLAIVIAALAADNQLSVPVRTIFVAELALDGTLRPVAGVLPTVRFALGAGYTHVVVSAANAQEAALVPGVRVTGAEHLGEVLELCGAPVESIRTYLRHRRQPTEQAPVADDPPQDLCLVNGQFEAKLALEIAAAGGHHLIMVGPAGAGKTMLARCLPGILPPLDDPDSLEATAIHSITRGGQGGINQLQRTPPFVAPHHTASASALLGGGSRAIRPGAITRAHAGILFLDEATEFQAGVLDALRQPVEEGRINLARASGHQQLPARFQLILAANPCPCGRNFGTGTACTCTPNARRRYFSKLSGPLLDRIDLQVRMNAVTGQQLLGRDAGEASAQVRERVLQARARATERLKPWGLNCNARLSAKVLRRELHYPQHTRRALERISERADLSARGMDRMLRVAWTIADQQEHQGPTVDDLDAALHFRQNLEPR
ncbi:Mg chelatase-like protein [Arthrobacter sp. MYb229]|uniref:YifB family Mg chelatase-like AAA ATPase n=1 Tax=unclassified Arthrobacter TaxID=235627 RepID=UPI000CFA941A|nr:MULTISPECIES: YifB family Mg chelatase-like AAA ATPase [unclassified Arthrobacter]PRA06878.1 Mg chelatase-like protein [Arthrobacter sp. MYb229]PRB53780.1 Mg chelatase-like protein [Arthrobacter sp. MYb216]